MDFYQLRSSQGLPTRAVLLLSLLLCLTLGACFGSSGSEDPAEAPTSTPLPPATEAPEPTATPVPTQAAQEAAAPEASEPQSFQIDPAQSEARFIVDEVLFGNPNTVTGRTSEISGTIEINRSDPTQTRVSEIQINARSLATDNRFRNRSVNRLILQSNRDEYQYITFTPTAINGLPAQANPGDTFSFEIVGDLKIRDIVQPTTFDVTVTADSETQISGLAQTVIQRADFELTIPEVDGVADVTEEVRLELEFVATASE